MRIAEFYRDQSGALRDLRSQSLSLLANGFSKWPSEHICREGIVAIAKEIRARGREATRLSNFPTRELATLANGFSKWPEDPDCRKATVAVADEVIHGVNQLSHAIPQDLANLVNAFSKWPTEASCLEATAAIACELHDRGGPLAGFDPQHIASLVNGFSKWPKDAACRRGAVAIARTILDRSHRANRLSAFSNRQLANLVNGFSKWPEEASCSQAAVTIAKEIIGSGLRASDFDEQALANLINAFSKWPDEATCREATIAIADEILGRAELSGFTHQELANLANGFSKWPEETVCRQAIIRIAGDIAHGHADPEGYFSDFTHQHLANLANAFSKCPEDVDAGHATVAIAREVLRRQDRLSGYSQQDLGNLMNSFSKWPEELHCRQAAVAIARDVVGRELSQFNGQELANLVNGFSKWPEEEFCAQATVAIACEIRDNDRLSDFFQQHLASLINDFSKWPEEAACRQVIVKIARGLGEGVRRFSAFTTLQLGIVANALARAFMSGEDNGEIAESALLKDRLHQLSHYLQYANDRLEQADVLAIANIFKALAKARLLDDLGSLASVGLDRLNELRSYPDFAAANNLETMGHLSAALLPLARSQQKQLRWHRRQALNLLNALQPIVEGKIEAHLNAGKAERARGPIASRRPALSIYQVLKARTILQELYRRPYVEGKKPDLQMRRQELQRKSREILASARSLVESDLSSMSWNLIAELESDEPLDALDTFISQNVAAVHAQHPPSSFDVHAVLREMDHEPRPPQGQAGIMKLPVVDMQGRRLATEPETRYSIFHRLTSGAVPVVAVQLPGKPSTFMLARTLTVDGVPYRMDLFGGSKLKAPKPTVSQIAARAPGDAGATTSGGKLLAVPYANSAPGTSFEQLSRAWAPFKEAYYYMQRRGFAAPPAINNLGPHDYALEGNFKLSLLPDRPAGHEHPFKLTGAEGPIALRPHDGCGFIRASLAERMVAVQRAGQQEGPDRVLAFGEGRRSSLPVSALQHYPRSEQVAREVREKAAHWLESRHEQELSSEQLFRTVTAGHIEGPGAVAVPSDDGHLHVPKLKSETLADTAGVLIGRSPYDKANLRPFALEQVKSSVAGDPTAAFLDKCLAMQYSFNVAEKSGDQLSADDPMFFAKGILIVVPDEMWPANYRDRGLVMSAEDVKSHSAWTERKDRVTADTSLDCIGILQATEIFAPGSLVAIPPDEQKKLDGDFDGDTAIIIGDRPQLYEHVRQFDQAEQARGVRSLKPPKSHTPAIVDGRYQFSRANQILAATKDVLEVYSCLQRSFLAQPDEARGWFAERAIFGAYEGIHHELKRDIRLLFDREQVSGHDVQDKLERMTREIEVAEHPVAREIAELLVADLEAWAASANEHLPPETIERVSEPTAALSQALSELFPNVAEAYVTAAHPRERVQAVLDHYPARIYPRADGYDPDDLIQSAQNLLSLGIKVGTDAYKSDTGTRIFMKKTQQLQRLLHQTPGLKNVPYIKSMAATLNQGHFDVDATLEMLKDNPTLAASVMEASVKVAVEKHILPKPFGRNLTAEDSGVTITLTLEEAAQRAKIESARAAAEEKEITATAFQVAEMLRQADIQVDMPHLKRRLRSKDSMTAELTGTTVKCDGDTQLISSAVRYVFEIPDKDFARAFKKAMLAFYELGYAEIRTTNWFRIPHPTFVGIKTVLATPGGYRFETEFHTPDSYQAKLDNHDAYKEEDKLRRQATGASLEESKIAVLAERVTNVCSEVPIPYGAKDLPHWDIEGQGTRAIDAKFGLRAAARTSMPKISPAAKEVVAALGVRPIVLVGLPAAGKSSIGPALARQLGLAFIDSDKMIEKNTGMTITEIFSTEDKGMQWFRQREASVIAQCVEKGNVVIATGGGAFESEETRSLIRDKAVSIWLDTNRDEIWKRLANDTSRPLLRIDKAESSNLAQSSDEVGIKKKLFEAMVEQRTPHYRQANLTVVPPHKGKNKKNVDACVEALHAYLCGN
ncbi:XopAD/skwp family type III secretion system effector [Bradyrhizobium sp. CB3481]|uniref:XopAD/skwp family type III secretion system effector n=1 Tax=Bradyrhizobium sp. CB3481 TaxID=3039158 RepID=UPI0024B03AD3|nr:XopAD/skwp family type III secretion system effector [Bradyrhizobium sp. CB3481]WFU14395.1 XopAD/skwp family type III secretion system effector [Bradyrhizobium sp. CB3481]